MMKFFQPFHLVSISPWPILTSFSILNLLIYLVYWMNFYLFNEFMFLLLILMFCVFQWWRDVIRESFFQGFHTINVIQGLKFGMILFIISEIFFFISIFWCYFHMFLSPSIDIGSNWPPYNIILFNPFLIPLLNTVILLSSGVSITWCHYSLIKGNKVQSILSLSITVLLGLIFTYFQFIEYKDSTYTISDSIFGSIFFMSTGFHGFHVLLGTMFLIVNLMRMIFKNFSKDHHIGFEMAAWYWHFVDVVWLFLYLLVYYWPY